MSVHEQFAEDLALYSLDALQGEERITLEKHLESCAACASACTALKAALLACRRAGTGEVRPEVQTAVKTAVHRWIAITNT